MSDSSRAAGTRPGSTPPCRTRPGSGTTGSAERTTTPSTAPPATSSWPPFPTSPSSPAPPARSWAAPCRYLAGEAGIRQFLDIGTGLPTFNSTHEIAQSVAPESRIVYVDNDPVVLTHATALLTGNAEGATDYLDADLRDPDKILAGAAKTLDFTRPVAVLLLGIMGHITDDGHAQSIVARLMDAVPSGSYLVLSDGTNVVHGEAGQAAQDDYNESGAEPYCLRSPAQLARFFAGLHLVEPGLVSVSRWRPDITSLGGTPPAEVDALGGVGRKP